MFFFLHLMMEFKARPCAPLEMPFVQAARTSFACLPFSGPQKLSIDPLGDLKLSWSQSTPSSIWL